MPMVATPHLADPRGALRRAALLLAVAASASSATVAASTTLRGPTYWYTYPDMSGNRVVGPGSIGCGGGTSFPDEDDVDIVDVDFGETAHVLWAVGVALTPSWDAFLGNGTADEEGDGCGDDDCENDEVFRFVVTLRNGTAYVVGPASRYSDEVDHAGATWRATRLEDYSPLDAEQPPLVRVDDEGITIVSLHDTPDMSPLSHPVPIPIPMDFDGDGAPSLGEIYAYIASNGDVVLWGEGRELHRLVGVDALRDGRIAVAHLDVNNGDNRGDGGRVPLLALYGGSTDDFRHCVLGNCVEGTRLLLIRVVFSGNRTTSSASALLEVEADIRLPDATGEVFEGTSPFFYNDDGNNLVVVTTVAKPNDGARLQTYSWSPGMGWQIRSVGPSIGWGWRHQLFRDYFGPNMTIPALVDVLAPHVRLTVEFFDDEHADAVPTGADDLPRMDLLASTSRYTTHRIGSRVLDTAVSGDVDGDGTREAVVLDENFRSLVGMHLNVLPDYVDGGGGFQAEEAWRLPLPSDSGEASSNLAAVSGGGGNGESRSCMALGIGAGNVFRMWLPQRRCGDGEGDRTGKISSTSEGSAASGSRGTMSPWLGTAVAMVSSCTVVVVGTLLPSNPA